MNNEVLSLQFINVKNCFLHLSSQSFKSLIGTSVCGLKLITSNGRELYFSAYSAPCTYVNGNSVGICQTFAHGLQLNEKENVIIVPLYNIGSLHSISVTPKSEDDFEILHSSALTLETSLLNQLRIVWPKQSFPVWVSANISVTLVVDSISPNLKYGRLEEYSEVVVASVVPKNGVKKAQGGPAKPLTHPVVDYNEKPLGRKKLKLRCVPLSSRIFRKHEFSLHPYVVFVQRGCLPEWATSVIGVEKNTAWRLVRDGEMSRALVVTVVPSDDFTVGQVKVSGLKTLFVSPLLSSFLALDLGSKVLLELIDEKEAPKASGILVSPTTQASEGLLEKVRKALQDATHFGAPLLLNTKAPLLTPAAGTGTEGGGSQVSITLRPLDVPWAFISGGELPSLSIDLNRYGPQSPVQPFLLEDETPTENYIPSYDSILGEGRSAVESSLGFTTKSGYKTLKNNVIYSGKNGSGKTRLLNCLQSQLRVSPHYLFTSYISCCSIKGKRIETLSKYLIEILSKCAACEPSVLLLDDLHLLTSCAEENTEAAAHVVRVSHKIAEVIDGYQKKHEIAVVATVDSTDHINPRILSSKGKSLFTSVIKIPNLEQEDKLSLVRNYLNLKYKPSEEDLVYISQNTEGFTPLDLKKLSDKAIFEVLQRKALGRRDLGMTRGDIKTALKESKPSSLHQINFFRGPTTSWADVGGLREAKDKLVEVVCWSTMYPEILKQCPVKPQTGVLIYGAPGTGKTLLAAALAGESKMNFISIKGPELMSKYIGESEEGIRKLFEKAGAARPCLLFFDEFDSLAPRRGQDQTGVTDRVVNQLLTALDGVDPMSGVWTVAATSRPDLIDPAVLRPGRIGISVHCPLPGESDRYDILKCLSSKTSLSDDVDLRELAGLCRGLTGADLKGLFTSAQIRAIDALQDDNGFVDGLTDLSNGRLPEMKLRRDDLLEALEELKPSLSESEKERYRLIYERFERRAPVNVQEQKFTYA